MQILANIFIFVIIIILSGLFSKMFVPLIKDKIMKRGSCGTGVIGENMFNLIVAYVLAFIFAVIALVVIFSLIGVI